MLKVPCALVFAVSCLAALPALAASPSCSGAGYIDPARKISDDFVALREAPDVHSTLLFRMGYGTRFAVCGSSGNWTLLQLSNGQRGFAATRLLTVAAEPYQAERADEAPPTTQDMIEEQNARATAAKQKDALAAAIILGIILNGGGGSSAGTGLDDTRRYDRDTPSRADEPSPSYTAPVGGERGLYGSDHGVD